MSGKEILDGKGEFTLLYRSPESFIGDERLRRTSTKQILLLVFEMHHIQLFIEKYIGLLRYSIFTVLLIMMMSKS